MALFITAVLLLCYGIGILAIRAGVQQIRLGLAARSWPTTDAYLEKCEVGLAPAGSPNVYRVTVKYAYAVAGTSYSGDSLAIGYGGSSNRAAHDAAQRRVAGMRRFVIRYHPGKPEISTIFPSENSLLFGTLVIGVFWVTLTTGFALAALAISGVGRAIVDWWN